MGETDRLIVGSGPAGSQTQADGLVACLGVCDRGCQKQSLLRLHNH